MTGSTHDYETREVEAKNLDRTMVLVGECGGLSAVVGGALESVTMPGFITVSTEHGSLYLNPADVLDVLDE